jgi:transcription elongation GreA/GreB family factor
MNDLQKQKMKMWEKKLAEANAFLGDALKRKSEAMNVGYLSENAYKMAIEEIEMGHARINEINNIINNIKSDIKK